MTDFLVIIRRGGFESYKELVLWVKRQVNLRTIAGHNNAVLRTEMVALFKIHFGLQDDEAWTLYSCLIEMGFLQEHYRKYFDAEDIVFGTLTAGLTLLEGRSGREYQCTTFLL